ncbi:hypothetical protein HOLleu_22024 [Holothuria leucospilota]|uniref:Helix-turn-helix domain-containing protein n=1 Tax=Holothuria leucospilota TaxID=206669 RepID=A0A9Q1BYQ1_HOLLE|nr:hypothetical protein HOLleu_22024 [Holothuria leucospilota]
MIWNHGEDQLHTFLELINSHPTIKFTYEFSPKVVNFLDVSVMVDDRRCLRTDLYSKPTDSYQYELPPGHIKRSIAFSQAIRIKRICSDAATAQKRCHELKEHLNRRGHSRKKCGKEIGRALARDETTRPRSPKKEGVPSVTSYHPGLPDISAILKKYQPLLHQSDYMRNAVPNLPVLSFRNPPSLRDTLVRAKLKAHGNDLLDPNRVCTPCGNKRCSLCNIMLSTSFLRSQANGKVFHLKAKRGSVL